MRVAAYYRVSTKGQGDDDRYGLARQQADVAAYAGREGHEIVREFRDVGFSGASADRPALAEMLEADGFEAIVVPAWDRLARDTTLDGYLRYQLERRGVKLLSATQENGVDPLSKLTQGILAAVAGYERHLISQRLSGARREKAKRGGYAHGRPPYGMRTIGGSLVRDEEEQHVLELMRVLRKLPRTYAAIAAELNARGFRSRTGELWQTSSVHYALTAELREKRDESLKHLLATRPDDPAHGPRSEAYAANVNAMNEA